MKTEKVKVSYYDLWDFLIKESGVVENGKSYAIGYVIPICTKEQTTESFFARDVDSLAKLIGMLSDKLNIGYGIRIHRNIWERDSVTYHNGQMVLHKHINV